MLFRITIKKVIGFESESPSTKELRKKFELFFQGVVSFPIYVPGTKFYQSMQVFANARIPGLLADKKIIITLLYIVFRTFFQFLRK